MSMPLSSTSFSSTRIRSALPPPKTSVNIARKFSRICSNVSRNISRVCDVDAVDHFQQLRLGLHEIVVLLAEELVALLGFLVFLDGHQVHRPHFVDALLQRLDLLRHRRPNRWPRPLPPFLPAS